MKYSYTDIQYMITEFQMCIGDIGKYPTIDQINKDVLINAYENAIFLAKYVLTQMSVEIPDYLMDKEEQR